MAGTIGQEKLIGRGSIAAKGKINALHPVVGMHYAICYAGRYISIFLIYHLKSIVTQAIKSVGSNGFIGHIKTSFKLWKIDIDPPVAGFGIEKGAVFAYFSIHGVLKTVGI